MTSAESAFVLNVMPWFKSGIHDRVLNAMYNGAVSITDSSSMMDTCFTPQQDYIAYSLDRIEALPDLLNTYVPDEDFRAQTAARASPSLMESAISLQDAALSKCFLSPFFNVISINFTSVPNKKTSLNKNV